MRKWIILLGAALAVVGIDQAGKALVVASLAPYEQWVPLPALEPIFTIVYVQNTGAAFGMLQDSNGFFTLVALLVSSLILIFYHRIPAGNWPAQLALGLMLGGATGNLIDRLRLGYVVDFFHLKGWPVFNVADSALVAGVLFLLLITWWQDRRAARASKAARGQEPPDPSPPPENPSSVTPG